MKKFLIHILAFAMAVSTSVVSFGADGISSGDSDSCDVKGTYNSKAVVAVYSVDIVWKDLNFTYNSAFEGTWNPKTHEYENGTTAGWSAGTGTITVTNHSNTDITATPSYAAKPEYESAGMSFSSKALKVKTADNGVDGAAGTAVVGTITVTPTGSLPEGTEKATIGSITITIN